MRKVTVPLGTRSYPVMVGQGVLASLGERCRKLGLSTRCAVISDRNVTPRFAPGTLASLKRAGFDPELITLMPGEKSKSLAIAGKCFDRLAECRLERGSFVVALGGGVIGDLAGFVAATYLRGVDLVQVPTTLLAQVDSSVGGKVGVNLRAGKNLVGAFLQPRLVLCDLSVLHTLPDREFRAGLAEVIKYGIIYDASLFERLERDMDRILHRDPAVLGPIIARCCEIKAVIVGLDEKEGGLRSILNFGHTVGHAIEAITGYGRYLHGEAISMGQVAAALLSTQFTGLSEGEAARVRNLLARAGLPVGMNLGRTARLRLMAAMRLDKKVRDGELRFVLAKRLGEVVWGQTIPEAALQGVLDRLRRGDA